MKDKIDWELIQRVLEGNHSRENEQRINEWLQSDSLTKKEFDLIRKIWETPAVRMPKPDVEKAMEAVFKRAGIDAGVQAVQSQKVYRFDKDQRSVPFMRHLFTFRILKIAALLLILVAIPYFLSKIIRPSSMMEIFVENVKQEKITLADNTLVSLDAGSVFRFPKKFDRERREVFLSGEGYFEVTPDPNRPFIVHANDAIITVLGTKFNVRAWRKSKKVVVAVANGSVSLQPEKVTEKESEVVISEGQMSVLEENEFPSIPEYTDIDEHVTWRHHEMHFKRSPLREVLDQLERWYNLEFTLADESYASNLVTVFIENKPIEDILELISLINNFEYEREGNKITFRPKE